MNHETHTTDADRYRSDDEYLAWSAARDILKAAWFRADWLEWQGAKGPIDEDEHDYAEDRLVLAVRDYHRLTAHWDIPETHHARHRNEVAP